MFPFRIRVCGPRGPHCHRRDRAPRSSSVHWSCSQETRAAETQSQAQGISAPLNPFHPHNPRAAFLPLISRETMWAEGRKRWHWLWSGVIFFSDWAAISISLKERKKKSSSLHIPCWLRQLVQRANIWCSENFLQRHFWTLFWVVLPGDAITLLGPQAYVGMSSNVWWTVVTLSEREGLCLIELISFVLLQCSSFLN